MNKGGGLKYTPPELAKAKYLDEQQHYRQEQQPQQQQHSQQHEERQYYRQEQQQQQHSQQLGEQQYYPQQQQPQQQQHSQQQYSQQQTVSYATQAHGQGANLSPRQPGNQGYHQEIYQQKSPRQQQADQYGQQKVSPRDIQQYQHQQQTYREEMLKQNEDAFHGANEMLDHEKQQRGGIVQRDRVDPVVRNWDEHEQRGKFERTREHDGLVELERKQELARRYEDERRQEIQRRDNQRIEAAQMAEVGQRDKFKRHNGLQDPDEPKCVREHKPPKGYPQHDDRPIEPNTVGGFYYSPELVEADKKYQSDKMRLHHMPQQQMTSYNKMAETGRTDPEGCLMLIRYASDRGDNVKQCKKFCMQSKGRMQTDLGRYIGVCEHVYCKEHGATEWPPNQKKSVLALWFENSMKAEEWLNCDTIFKQQDCLGGLDVLTLGVRSSPKVGDNVLMFQTFNVRDADCFKNTYSAHVGDVVGAHNGHANLVCTVHARHLKGYWPVDRNAFVQIHAFPSADDVIQLHKDPNYKSLLDNACRCSSCRTVVFPLDTSTSLGPPQMATHAVDHHQQKEYRH